MYRVPEGNPRYRPTSPSKGIPGVKTQPPIYYAKFVITVKAAGFPGAWSSSILMEIPCHKVFYWECKYFNKKRIDFATGTKSQWLKINYWFLGLKIKAILLFKTEGPALLEICPHRPWVKLEILLLPSQYKRRSRLLKWMAFLLYLFKPG